MKASRPLAQYAVMSSSASRICWSKRDRPSHRGRFCEDPLLRRTITGLVDEGKAVAAAQGISLDADPEELIDHAAKPEVAYDHKASMLQDVEAHRPTEIDYLNGGIVGFGREHGVPTPLNRAIWSLVKGLEQSW